MNTARVLDLQEKRQIDTIARYKDVQDTLKALRREEKELKALLMDWIAENDSMTVGGYTAVHKVGERKGIDTDTLKLDLPEIWTEYGKVTKTHSIIVC